MPVAFRRIGWVNGVYVAPTTYCPMDGPDWAKGEQRAEAKSPQRGDDDDDDAWYAQQRRERALKALNGSPQAPVAAPPKKSATEVVDAWVAAHEAEGISRAKAIADLRKRDPKLVMEWVAEFNAKHGR